MARVKRLRRFRQSSNIKPRGNGIRLYHLKAFDQKRTSMENLSNEIFYEIFDYLEGYDIHKAFSNLNIRFHNLFLHSSFLMKIHFSSTSILDHRYQQFIQSHKHHILSFHSSNEYFLDKLISFYLIDSSFYRLESFIFDQISPLKLLVYLFHLKSLPRLFSLIICLSESYDDLGDIYTILFRFPVLKYLKLEILDDQETDLVLPMVNDGHYSPIEHLVIYYWCTLNELTDILSHTPQLSHLSYPNLVQSEENLNGEVLMKLTNLVYLNVMIVDLDLEEFEGFLLHFSSQLQVLDMTIQSSDKNYLDANRWERFISEKMPSLTKFLFCYTDTIYDDFESNPYHSLIKGFYSPFWIERRWMLRISVSYDEILYNIRPYRETFYDFPEQMDIPMINSTMVTNSSLHWLSGAHIDFNISLSLVNKNRLFLKKINSLFPMIEITRLDVQCRQIPADLFIQILNLLPNLHMIQISDLPSYEEIYKSHPDISALNQFLMNNKITKLSLRNISNFEQIDLIIHFFPRLQYLALRSSNHIGLEATVEHTLLKIQENKTFHPLMLCIFAAEAENDQVRRLKQMIDSRNLLQDYTIHRRLERFYLQWK